MYVIAPAPPRLCHRTNERVYWKLTMPYRAKPKGNRNPKKGNPQWAGVAIARRQERIQEIWNRKMQLIAIVGVAMAVLVPLLIFIVSKIMGI